MTEKKDLIGTTRTTLKGTIYPESRQVWVICKSWLYEWTIYELEREDYNYWMKFSYLTRRISEFTRIVYSSYREIHVNDISLDILKTWRILHKS